MHVLADQAMHETFYSIHMQLGWHKLSPYTYVQVVPLGWQLFAGTFFCDFGLKQFVSTKFCDWYVEMVQGQHILMFYSAYS